MNYSWQRQLIIDTIQNKKEHMTAAQIYELARKNCPRLSLGTVYRNLNQLVDAGMIGRVGVPGEADRYDWELDSHQHFYCRKCKKVRNLPVPALDLTAVRDACPQAEVEDYQFMVTGICADCAQKAEEE